MNSTSPDAYGEKIRFAEKTVCTTLDNGLKILVFPRPGTGTVFTQTVVKTGSANEGKYLGCGLSHFLEHMMFSGTESYPGPTQISDRVNQLGGSLNASTGYRSTQYYMELLPSAAEEAVDMLFSMIAHPLFPEAGFNKEKEVILRECAMRDDDPDSILFERFLATACTRDPARFPVIGFREKIASVTREIMTDYYETRYAPGRSAFIVAGDVDASEITDYIAAKASAWRVGRIDEPALNAEPEQNSARKTTLYFNDPLARAVVGFREPGMFHPDDACLDVLSSVLGDGDSSRLFRELVADRRAASDVNIYRLKGDAETFSLVRAQMKPENTDAVLDGIRTAVDSLRTKPATEGELAAVSAQLENGFYALFRSNAGIGRLISRQFASGQSLEQLDAYPEKLRAVTSEDITRAAALYETPEHSTTVVQLPESMRPKRMPVNAASAGSAHPVLRVLPGGQNAVFFEDHEVPLVNVTMILPAGQHFEKPDEVGISALTADLLSCGAGPRGEEEFNRVLDENGIEFSASAQGDRVVLAAGCLAGKLPLLAELLKTVLAEPRFEEDKLRRETENRIDEIRSLLATPVQLAIERFATALYGAGHPVGYPSESEMAVLPSLTGNDIRACWKKMCCAQGCVAAVGGAVDADRAEAFLTDVFSAVEWTGTRPPDPVLPAFPAGTRDEFISLDKEQALVLYGFPGLTAPEMTPVHALIQIASNGMSSHLFKTVREERGLAYYTGFATRAYNTCGHAFYYAGTRPGAEVEVFKLFEEERLMRAEQGFSEAEFEAAKATALYDNARGRQNRPGLAAAAAFDFRRGHDLLLQWRLPELLKSLTLNDMNEAAKRFFTAPSRVRVAVSPEKNRFFPSRGFENFKFGHTIIGKQFFRH